MNSDKISLPDFLLADLYKDSLVLVENELDVKSKPNKSKNSEETEEMILINKTEATIPATAAAKQLSFLGSNSKHISIVVKDEDAIHLQDELLDILSAILTACKLNLADVAIINSSKQLVNDAVLREQFTPKNVILFGVETTAIDLPFSIPLYKPQPFNNCTYLQSVGLDKMKGKSEEARVEKSKLWVSLKSLFGI